MLKVNHLRNAISAISIEENDYHQAILDVCYDRWQSEKGWSYEDMTTWARLEFGKIAQLMVFLGKYNQQVCNGGHAQYFDNRYASGSGSFNEHDEQVPLHRKMMELMIESGLHDTELGSKIYDIQNDFFPNLANHFHNEEFAKEHGCYEDDDYDPFDELDKTYYTVYGEWMPYLNNYITQWLEIGKNPLEK